LTNLILIYCQSTLHTYPIQPLHPYKNSDLLDTSELLYVDNFLYSKQPKNGFPEINLRKKKHTTYIHYSSSLRAIKQNLSTSISTL